MPDRLELANMALNYLGAEQLSSLNDDSLEAQIFRSVYDLTLETMLEAHPWNFAEKAATLGQSADTDVDFDFAYTLPNDCIRAKRIKTSAGRTTNASYKIRGRLLLTNQDGVQLVYTAGAREQDFTPSFAMTLTWALAAQMAMPITESETKAQYCSKMAEEHLRRAKLRDSQSDTPDKVDDFTLIAAHSD